MSQSAPISSNAARGLLGEDFDWADAIGGWRGLAEAVAPGAVFVAAFALWGGYRIPVLASVGSVVVLVMIRLIQRTPVTQALGGLVGVGIGAIWAWRAGDANEYFAPGLWYTGVYGLLLVASMVARWPAVGVVVALLKGWGSHWRQTAAPCDASCWPLAFTRRRRRSSWWCRCRFTWRGQPPRSVPPNSSWVCRGLR